jgi:hypothetical protein
MEIVLLYVTTMMITAALRLEIYAVGKQAL